MDEGKKLTPKLIQQLMMDGYERTARQAEKDTIIERRKSIGNSPKLKQKTSRACLSRQSQKAL